MYYNLFLKDMMSRFLRAENQAPAFALYESSQIREISYPSFAEDVLRSAAFFRAGGIIGRHIAILGPDSYEWCRTFFDR